MRKLKDVDVEEVQSARDPPASAREPASARSNVSSAAPPPVKVVAAVRWNIGEQLEYWSDTHERVHK